MTVARRVEYARGARAAAALLVLALASVGPGCAPRALVLTEAADGSQVDLHVGQVLMLELPGNPTTGYAWEITGAVPPVLALLAAPTPAPATDDTPRVGASRPTLVRLRAAAPGEGTLTLAYRRPWETEAPPARVFRCAVTVR